MPSVQIFVATRDGQSERIATHMAARLAEHGIPAFVTVLRAAGPVPLIDMAASLVITVAAIRYGKHLKEADAFLGAYATHRDAPPLALASVNLVARKPDRQTPETNQYLRKLILRHGLKPVVAAAFGGRLSYPKYGWLDRQMIRLIMLMTGGNADGRSVVEYTDWDQVDRFVADVRARLSG